MWQKKVEKYNIPKYHKPIPLTKNKTPISDIGYHSREVFWTVAEREMPNNILDVGCGWGRDAPGIIKLGIKYVGIDPFQQNLNIAKKKHPLGIFKRGFAQEIPYPNNSFTWVLARGLIECLPTVQDKRKGVSECIRVVEKSVFIIDYGLAGKSRVKDRETSSVYVPSGFKVTSSVLVGLGTDKTTHYIITTRIHKTT